MTSKKVQQADETTALSINGRRTMTIMKVITETRESDEYVNATRWCQHFGKELKHYKQLKETKLYLDVVQERVGENYPLFVSKNLGGNKGVETFVHPLVAVHLASWLSPKFAVEVNSTFSRVLKADVSLALDILKRAKNDEKKAEALAEITAKYLSTYHPLFDEVKHRTSKDELPGTCAAINATNTLTVQGDYPNNIVREKGGKSARAHMTAAQAGEYIALQNIQCSALKKTNAHGKDEVVAVTNEVADDFQKFLNKWS